MGVQGAVLSWASTLMGVQGAVLSWADTLMGVQKVVLSCASTFMGVQGAALSIMGQYLCGSPRDCNDCQRPVPQCVSGELHCQAPGALWMFKV